ncbi:glycerophosphodiester phosphodiesterase [Deinococcus lacus]|uniref:Glycerophosphodiester phosphodiesterase n=1 Tax=Deinococcus lacus TaxID=392561 RepID=A0ABW1YA54_9DEIO
MSAPLLLGHRGSPRQHPENTLAGFQAAVAAGLGGIELDVQCLADGTLAVHHDPDLADGRALYRLTRAELPAPVPTLPGVLAWAVAAGTFVNVEIKADPRVTDDRAALTVQAIRAAGLEQVIISSFDVPTLAAVRSLAPELECGYLFDPREQSSADAVAQALALGCAALHPHFAAVSEESLAHAHAAGLRVNVWTVNDAAEVARLRALGADGLIGDVPAVLLGRS